MDRYEFENQFRVIFLNDKVARQKKQLLLEVRKLGLGSVILSYPFVFALIIFGNGNGLSNSQSLIYIAAAFASFPLWVKAGRKQQTWRAV